MNTLEPKSVYCPYCGEQIEVLIDPSIADQNYIEDCQVCCSPIQFLVSVDYEGDILVSVKTDTE